MSKKEAVPGELFSAEAASEARDPEIIAEGAVLLRGFASESAEQLIRAVEEVTERSPFRNMAVRGGRRMSVAMTNCGRLGWVSDETGYRYDAIDPLTGHGWPPMPASFERIACGAASEAGFENFAADACLINRYEPGAQMGLHQDKNELDYDAPIVSVSLGLRAVFLFGGMRRSERPRRYSLDNGDVVVWGGPARLVYHGVAKLAEGVHSLTGRTRINLTFRKASA